MDALIAFLLLTAAGSPDASPTDQGPDAEREQKICKRETTTATRVVGKRICRTAAQWAEEEEKGQLTGGLEMFSKRNGTGDVGGLSGSGDSPR